MEITVLWACANTADAPISFYFEGICVLGWIYVAPLGCYWVFVFSQKRRQREANKHYLLQNAV